VPGEHAGTAAGGGGWDIDSQKKFSNLWYVIITVADSEQNDAEIDSG